ncbi:hypothetical protein LTR85_003732 [Meristemomyces frigidus]|nr:hypothetical protein LTR85_003732 [Meristemomyces frigidus]
MIHPDGIEVYLKPTGKEGEGIKYAEFPVSSDRPANTADDRHEMRSIILARDEDFTVIVRCKPSFKMFAASALLIRIDDGFASPAGATYCPKSTIQRSRCYEQLVKPTTCYYTVERDERKYNKCPHRMREASKALNGGFDSTACQTIDLIYARPGTILVTVHRGTAQWEEKTQLNGQPCHSPFGPDNPAEYRSHMPGTSRPLPSKHGQLYTFEFRYRSEAYVRQCAKEIAGSGETPLDGTALAVVPDAEFARNRERDYEEREKMGIAWLKREAELAKEGEGEGSPEVAKDNNAVDVPTVTPTGGGAGKVPRRNNQPPKFCNCPVLHQARSKPSKARRCPAAGPKVKELSVTQRIRSVTIDGDDDVPVRHKATGASDNVSLQSPGQFQAPVCLRCSGIKITQDRRPAYLRQWYENDNTSLGLREDEDDEEPNVGAKIEAAADTAVEHDAAAGDVLPLSASPSMPPEVAANDPTRTEKAGTDVHPPSSQSVISVEAAANNAAASENAAINQPAPSLSADIPQEVRAQDGTTPRVQLDDVVAAAPTSSEPDLGAKEISASAGAVQGGARRSTKRVASAELQSSKTKHPRVDVDLTCDDEELVEIKIEQAATMAAFLKSSPDAGEDEEDLRERLREIELADQRLQLREEKMKVEAKLKAMQRKKAAKSSVKVEETIKLED